MCEAFQGEWKLESSENFDELLKKLEMNSAMRAVAGKFNPKMRFEKLADDSWKITTVIPIKSHSMTFKLGEPFVEVAPFDGRKHKVVFTIEDDKMIQKTLDEADNDKILCVSTRDIMPDGKMRVVSDDISSV